MVVVEENEPFKEKKFESPPIAAATDVSAATTAADGLGKKKKKRAKIQEVEIELEDIKQHAGSEIREKKKTTQPRRTAHGGLAIRKPRDTRLVLQVIHRTPHYWVSMNVNADEVQLIEVKKYSYHYFEIESKFRRPNLELASAYVAQNPYLWGQYLLRRDQMKMQNKALTEKEVFYPVAFSDYEDILRSNFNPFYYKKSAILFFTEACSADRSLAERENVKLMLMTKVLVGNEVTEEEEQKSPRSYMTKSSKSGLITDTVSFSHAKTLYKFNATEMYPDILLIYRNTDIEEDTRSCQLTTKHVKVLLRSGKRYNPDEIQRKKDSAAARVNKEVKDGANANPDEIVALVEDGDQKMKQKNKKI